MLCHASGKIGEVAAAHALSGKVEISGPTAATGPTAEIVGADVVVKFTVKVDGLPANDFTLSSGYKHAYNANFADTTTISGVSYPVKNKFERTSITTTLTSVSAGVYTVTVTGAAATASAADTYLIRMTNPSGLSATAAAGYVVGGEVVLARDLVGNQACMNCHGTNVFASGSHHGANPQGVSACVVCHTVVTSQSRGAAGDRLTSYVHGIHNSHNMPARNITANLGTPAAPYTVTKPEGVYARNDSLKLVNGVAQVSSPFSIGFPSYMNNCSICHDTDARLAAVMEKPVSFSTCMSCHDSFEAFPKTKAGAAMDFHGTYNATTDCTMCHKVGGIAFANVSGAHGGQAYTERNGLLYGGKDQSIVEGKKIAMTIGSVTVDAANKKLIVKWSATVKPDAVSPAVAVDPCNSDLAAGPVFIGLTANSATGQSASNMAFLQAYAQGNDWVNAGVGTSPGQPVSENLTTTNTTCSANVATSTITAATTTATKGVVALQGKPQIKYVNGSYNRVIQVRSPSPTREFMVADGAAPSSTLKRRQIVSNDKCLACHPGSLYQHGGNRVDNVELCVTCHNPAANEANNRVGMGITAANSYDGRNGQTYDLRYMIHAIHSAGETNRPLVYYRSNGIYAFGSQAAIDGLPSFWPGAGSFTVANSNPATTRTHNEIVVHYPRALNDCQACHLPGTETKIPDQTAQMGVTVDAGAAPWGNQADDVLMGAATASCTSCHASGATNVHVTQFGWTPSAIEGGRQGLMDAAK
ncbi:MAG TPA: cytochrome c3 family protein [Anaeromyxobacteraceae bacterium]|nr:cytochrome c3 family protein [Anaeromyxobacteraceae bacterium]